MSWSLLISPILLFVSFLAFMPFHLCFFLSAAFRFLSVCQASVFPLWFFPPANCFLIILFCMFIRQLRFSVWFWVLERSQSKGKNKVEIHDKQHGMGWQAFFPILLLLLPPLVGLIMLLLQAFILLTTPWLWWLLVAPLLPLLLQVSLPPLRMCQAAAAAVTAATAVCHCYCHCYYCFYVSEY